MIIVMKLHPIIPLDIANQSFFFSVDDRPASETPLYEPVQAQRFIFCAFHAESLYSLKVR